MTDPQHEETFADTERKLREIITTLRAQLAEAHKDGTQLAAWQCLFEDGKTGIVCDDWGNQYCAMQRRADRAEQRVATLEAALAAQIEVDAGICDALYLMALKDSDDDLSSPWKSHKASAYGTSLQAIRNQPHDRTALDWMLAEAREVSEADKIAIRNKALREAAQACNWGDIYGDNAVRTILALIEKEKPNDIP